MSEQSRITVVGTRKRVDVAVPSWTPVGEYAARLAGICGQDQGDVMPPVWSLGVAGEPPLPLDASLIEAGVVDGQVLYLRDTAREPAEAPLVAEIDEVVAEETRRLRAHKLRGGPATVVAGLVWLSAAGVLAAWWSGGGAGASIVLILAGLVLLGVAWGLTQQRDVAPFALRLMIALTAVVCMAAAGVLAGRVVVHGAYPWESGLVGANVGALLAFAALPEGLLFAVQGELLVALATAVLIRGLGAHRSGGAAVIAVVAMGMLAMSRRVASFVAAWSQRRADARRISPIDVTHDLIERSRQVLAVVVAGPGIALTVALPMLALSGRAFALILTGAVGLTLLARARHTAFTSEVVTIGATAATGCFGLGLAAVRALDVRPDGAVGLLTLAGIVVVGVGTALCVLMPPAGTQSAAGPSAPSTARRRTTMDVVGVVTAVAMTPLALGVFGVYGQLLQVGRTLF